MKKVLIIGGGASGMMAAIMAISLSQKVDSSMNLPSRAILGYGITDEIFGVAMAADHDVGRRYFAGLMTLPILGWTLVTSSGIAPYSMHYSCV